MKAFTYSVLIGASLAVLTLATDAVAEGLERCTDTVTMHDQLYEHYGEEQDGFGLDQDGWLTEFFVNVDTGTWSWVVTVPGRESCILRTGVGWNGVIREPVPGAQGEPM